MGGVFSTIKLDIPSEKLSGIKSMSEMPNAMDEFFWADDFHGSINDDCLQYCGLDYSLSCNFVDY